MRLLKVAALGAALMLLAVPVLQPAVAFAAATTSDTSVTIPWGDWVNGAVGLVGSLLALAIGAMLTWALRFVPGTMRAFITDAMIRRVEQLLDRAVTYGLNAVAGAARDKELSVDVGSRVVAEAAQYAIDNGPGKLIAWMGGAQGVKEKILARIPLVAAATAGEVLAKAPPVTGE